jgi:hypothetical protein
MSAKFVLTQGVFQTEGQNISSIDITHVPSWTFPVAASLVTSIFLNIVVNYTEIYWRRSAVLWVAVLLAVDEARGNDRGQKELIRRIGKSAAKGLCGEALDCLAKS